MSSDCRRHRPPGGRVFKGQRPLIYKLLHIRCRMDTSTIHLSNLSRKGIEEFSSLWHGEHRSNSMVTLYSHNYGNDAIRHPRPSISLIVESCFIMHWVSHIQSLAVLRVMSSLHWSIPAPGGPEQTNKSKRTYMTMFSYANRRKFCLELREV